MRGREGDLHLLICLPTAIFFLWFLAPVYVGQEPCFCTGPGVGLVSMDRVGC